MQTILIVDDEPHTAEALAGLLEEPGRTLVICTDVQSAEIVVERAAPDCVLTDLQFTGPFCYDGLGFVQFVRNRAPRSRIVVITGAHDEGLEAEARLRGADAMLQKPLQRAALEDHLDRGHWCGGRSTVLRVPSIDEVIASGRLVPKYQPIIDLSAGTRTIHGFESLARFDGTIFSNPLTLFDYAQRKGRLVDLELVCVEASFAAGTRLAAAAKLFLNIHPAVIRSERLGETLTRAAFAAGIPPQQTVLEITEQGPLGDSATVRRQCEDLRARGFAFAIDDIGMAYSHLAHIDDVQPEYLKISPEFGGSFEGNPTRLKIVKHALSLARDFGCQLILEGIESIETRDAALDLGIPLGQGFFFDRPAAAGRFLDHVRRAS
jgi:EAL domain-containing protein (putative c-di-GMP-specific phosphodiesterase class I)